MKLIDTSGHWLEAYENGVFSMERWREYIDAYIPGAYELCTGDLNDCIAAGCSWEEDYLPVLNAVITNAEAREKAIGNFKKVTENLDERIIKRFGRTVEADIVLYLGLGNGAGWVTPMNGRMTVLLGIEKIIELGWCGEDDMNGLVLHELGHVYHSEASPFREYENSGDGFYMQLFREGIAMVFEQELLSDAEYYHQQRGGWREWCADNVKHIAESFAADAEEMTLGTQRYFGDWVSFEGRPDTGYYLGARLVRHMMRTKNFDELLDMSVEEVREAFAEFAETL